MTINITAISVVFLQFFPIRGISVKIKLNEHELRKILSDGNSHIVEAEVCWPNEEGLPEYEDTHIALCGKKYGEFLSIIAASGSIGGTMYTDIKL